jgi:hypothetical protein
MEGGGGWRPKSWGEAPLGVVGVVVIVLSRTSYITPLE